MSNYVVAGGKKLASIAVGFGAAALLAQYLGPAQRGELALILNGAAIAVVVLNLGVSNAYQVVRRGVGTRGHAVSFIVYAAAAFTAVASAAFLWFAIAASTAGLDYGLGLVLMVAAVSLFRLQVQSVAIVEHYPRSALAAVAGAISELAALVLLWLLYPPVLWLGVLAVVVKELVTVFASLVLLAPVLSSTVPVSTRIRLVTNLRERVVRSYAVAAPLSRWRLFLLTVLITTVYKVDVLFLGFYGIEASQIGVFVVGVLLADYMWLASDLIKEVQTSRTARGSQADDVAVANRSALFVTLIVYVSFVLLGQPIVKLVFGAEYVESTRVAMMMLIANIFMIPCKILGTYLTAVNRVTAFLKAMVAAVLVNVTLNAVLIPYFGTTGAISSSIAAYAVAGAITTVAFIRITGSPLVGTLVARPSDLQRLLRGEREL